MKAFTAILGRDLRLTFARGAEGMMTIFLFFVIVSIFPFVFNNDAILLQKSAAGILWVAMLLSSLLSLESVYHRDFDDGTFALLFISPVSLLSVIAAKICGHWVLSGLTLLLASVVASQLIFVPWGLLPGFLCSLFLGTVYLTLLGGMGACLTFGSRRPGLLLVLLILPLFLPMLILGVSAAEAGLAGLSIRPYLLLQLAMAIVALPVMPLVAAQCLKMHVRSS